MYLSNFHFYNPKNNLYSKPVKGLQGYEVGYGFSFNGKEKDDETQTQDYGMRIYDFRLGRFLSIDPLSNSYPMLTPYQFASNTPIMGIDLDGLELRNALYNYSNTGERLELKKSTDKEVADKIDLAIAALKKDDIKLYEFLDKYKINVEAKELPNEYDENGNIKSHSLGESNVLPNKINYVTKYDREFGAGAFSKLAESDSKTAEEYRQNNLTIVVEFSATIYLDVNKIQEIDMKSMTGSFGKQTDRISLGRVMKHEAGHFLYDVKKGYDLLKLKWNSDQKQKSEERAQEIDETYDEKPKTVTNVDE